MQSLIVKGSIKDVAKTNDVALTILDAKVVILCDRSGSMLGEAWGHRPRYELEDEIITKLQAKYAGQIVLVAFHDVAYVCLDGVLPPPQGNTNMLDAFRVAEPFHDAGLRVILISDGEPSHDPAEVILAAQKFSGNMDAIFVGDELSPGKDFLKRLAKAVGGSSKVADLKNGTLALEEGLTQLLLGAGTK